MAAHNFVFQLFSLDESAELGERANQLIKLRSKGFSVPSSFVIKSQGFFHFIRQNSLEKKIKHLLGTVDLEKAKSVQDTAKYINKHLHESEIPLELTKEILDEYKKISGVLRHGKASVFLSHPHENHQPLTIAGDASLLATIKSIWTSLYPLVDTNPTIVVQQLLKGKSGKMRTSTKLVKTYDNLSVKEKSILEKLATDLKKEFYFPHEIDWLLKDNEVYILKLRPETPAGDEQFPETNYTITRNSVQTV